MGGKAYKVGGALAGGAGVRAYQDLVVGSRSWLRLLLYELVMLFAQNRAGALGLWLRKKLYPLLLGTCGSGCLFGRGVTLRHPHKIRLGQGVVIDEMAMLDAKGEDNRGITLGDRVYIGRHSIVYTKGGDIELAAKVNVSHNCELFSSNLLEVGEGSFIAAYSYLLSGGEYDTAEQVPLSEQSGTISQGPTQVGANVWIAAQALVTDGSQVGDNAVVAAGAMVRGEVPPGVLVAGRPARVMRQLKPDHA